MSYLTKLRALRREEDSTNKLNKCNYFNTLNNSATKETNLTKNVPPVDGPTEEYGEGGHGATKETKYTKKVPVSPGSLDALSVISAKPQTDTLESPPLKVALRCRSGIVLRLDGETITFEPGNVFTVSPDEATGLLEGYSEQLERLNLPPSTAIPQPTRPVEPPLQPGWIVAYRDWGKGLSGGWGDKGTVSRCEWDGTSWMVTLLSGERLFLRQVTSVGKTIDGRLVTAWTTREHGYDGEGSLEAEEPRAASKKETEHEGSE